MGGGQRNVGNWSYEEKYVPVTPVWLERISDIPALWAGEKPPGTGTW